MKTKFILNTILLIGMILTTNITLAQGIPTIRVDGNKILTDLEITPLWLRSGQTLEIGDNTQFISVLEFNKSPLSGGGNSLIFEDVIIVTTPAATVPNGKVWKVEHVGIDENATLAGTFVTQANACQTPTNLQIVNNENATITINWNAPASPPAYGYSISVMPAGLAPTSQDFFTVTGTTITVSTFSHDNSNINATTAGIGIDVYLISTCNVVTNQYSDPINGQGTVTCDLDNLQLGTNYNGTITAIWTESISGFTPANGYMVAVVPQGTSPQSGDYVAESGTNFATTQYTDNTNIPNNGDVDVYVYAVCNANSDSDPINATTIFNCDLPTNLQLTDNGNGPITATWNVPTNNTPTNGYMIAVVPQGTTPQSGDYVAENSTSFTTGFYTNNNLPFMGNPDIDVYVYAVCNANSNSDPISDNILLSCVPFTLNFTNCSQTGRTGPSQSQCNTAYNNTTLAGLVTVSGGIQEWTVPATGTYIIEVAGARGGTGSGYTGGLGASMEGSFSLTAGQTLKVLVGQMGENNSSYKAAGGGGGTFVTDISDTPLIIAGGGGAGGGNSNPSNGQSGLTGTSGGNGSQSQYAGGTNGNGGAAGSGSGAGGGLLTNGANGSSSYGITGGSSFITGGAGGQRGSCSASTQGGHGGFGGGGGGDWCSQGAAGGGGGYSGGGATDSSGVPGGGGSYNSGANQNNQAGVNSGHGYVNIQLVCP